MADLIDTHCHIQSIGLAQGERSTRELWAKASDITADGVVAEAVAEGVTKMVCVGCDLEDSRLAIEFVQNRPECWASIGLHPHEAKEYADNSDALNDFAALATQPKVVAIGECGFDFYYNHSPKAAQIAVLEFQLQLAQDHNLPVIFHVREAFDDFWPVFNNFSQIRGVLHSFTDTLENLRIAADRGLFIGVNGIATFVKDDTQRDVYRQIPLENLVFETDAPFLTPAPYRGSINRPKHIGRIVDFMSELRGQTIDELTSATTSNARSLFGI